MRTIANPVAGAGVAILALVVLTACGSGTGEASNSGTSGAGSTDPIAVVASTNVWGDVVAQVGGDQVAVTALVADPAADPHSFEPNAQAQLALSKAALVVENGGGYDDFVQIMLDSAGTTAPVINAVEVSGLQDAESHTESSAETGSAQGGSAGEGGAGEGGAEADHEHGEFNEHVWYDLPTVDAVASRIADELTAIRPDQAAFFQANLVAFRDRVAGLTAKVDAIKADHDGVKVAITEPVPLYLTEAAGLVNLTPAGFSAAIEQGTDVPPTVLADTLALFRDHQVVALVYNEQTSSPETEQVLTAARDNSIAVVGVTETLPEGKDYLSWMDSNIAALAGALDG